MPTVIYPEKRQVTFEDIKIIQEDIIVIKQTLDLQGRTLADLNQQINQNQMTTKPFYLSKINIATFTGFLSLLVSILELQQLTNLFPQEAIPYLLAISAVLNLVIGYLRTFEMDHKNLQ